MSNLHPHIRTNKGVVFFNPGSGSVDGTTEADARANVASLVSDLKIDGKVTARRYRKNDYGEGRYCFRLYHLKRSVEIQMPGLELDKVRFTGEAGQNIWDFPRLYVDGSSWVWQYAVSVAHDYLLGVDEDES